ncbi:tRNA (adenosine(37)-N6)-dimethylallyltransferase MiaA [Stieleria sp. TO1_6]|uniref:tRNA (adenosine(37)-N6)-dimethylallyltransferase MiaA n=1 Tax=Stieleria tagensis TaxID=2956795 RepID=UPI00209A7CD7|nr:tRNA (adenosine(37)-N6)-dimethylallyltransferase MiaA [Stieleria tagensis]MCO8122910.1 tRNA (adenosine(37)-N6)-dimethylallyltransferase MiaA [Stieleria tagensis]
MPAPTPPATFPPLVGQAIVLTGSTASGKSSLAIKLAERIEGEILSLDSIAVYRYMDIGTAKPSRIDQQQVSHHLIDLADPDQDFSVAYYLAEAHRCVAEVLSRGKRPIFVGGTPMYLKAILRGFDPGPPPDWQFRESVERDVLKFGVDALRDRLIQVDPLSAARIAPGDTRRMIRALEVSKLTGVPLSHRQIQFDRMLSSHSCSVFAIKHDRKQLHQRINQRVKQMFDSGLLDEVRSLLERFGPLSRTAAQAVGYRETIDWIAGQDSDVDTAPLESLQDAVATHTRQLAKRQETWFRSFQEITPISVTQPMETDSIINALVEHIQRVDTSQLSG